MTCRALALTAACLLLCARASAQEGHAFPGEAVERMKAWAIQNATGGSPEDCIHTLNQNVRLLFNDPAQRLALTVDKSMAALQAAGRAAPTQTHEFFDEDGRPTVGVTGPRRLRESVWDALLAWAGTETGYFVFGMSLLDGNHSVLLVLDRRDPEAPEVRWIDQWSSKGGWKLYPDKESLDGEIERLSSSWWKSKLSGDGIRFRSRTRLYPLLPKINPTLNRAEVSRAPLLRMRKGPGTDFPQLRDAEGRRRYFKKGEVFEVLAREGKWVKLRLPDGGEAWGHSAFLRLFHEPEAVAAVPEAAGHGAVGALGVLSDRGE
ncbi:MAG: SH3 domain-containing protein [Planctomycetota bacterium]|nr:MAG: SH3 domain-containing protein [Planctomycetota bacterium]